MLLCSYGTGLGGGNGNASLHVLDLPRLYCTTPWSQARERYMLSTVAEACVVWTYCMRPGGTIVIDLHAISSPLQSFAAAPLAGALPPRVFQTCMCRCLSTTRAVRNLGDCLRLQQIASLQAFMASPQCGRVHCLHGAALSARVSLCPSALLQWTLFTGRAPAQLVG